MHPLSEVNVELLYYFYHDDDAYSGVLILSSQSFLWWSHTYFMDIYLTNTRLFYFSLILSSIDGFSEC